MPFFSSDSQQRFDPSVPQETTVWVNNSEPALFKWRYTPPSTDTPPTNIKCYFEEDGKQIFVIRRRDSNNPDVQSNDIRNTKLNGEVQGYMDSTDPTVFGFIIKRASKSQPKIYQCTANFVGQSGPDDVRSQKLSLQVLGNIAMLFFCLCVKEYIFFFLETSPFAVQYRL